MVSDPFERHFLEVRILIHLNEFRHLILLDEVSRLVPDHEMTTIDYTYRLKDDGLVTISEIGGGRFVQITPQGRNVLATILSGRVTCR